MESLTGSVFFAATCFLVFLCFKWFDKRLLLGFGILFAVYIGIDDVLTGLPSLVPALKQIPGRWNWAGKILSILFSLIVILTFQIDRTATGLILKQRNISKSLIALLILTLLSFFLGIVFKPELPDAETILFQTLMPGLAEEIAYRGIAPALLLGLIASKSASEEIPWAVILITGISFGVWHGISFHEYKLSFDLMSALFPLLGGIAYGWLRFSSGSLLLPIIAHGAGNTVFYLWSFI
ncbi:MAG: CPBP family intramembrane metalloprotease [Bacteroidetes bacterium]|nr:CPBP family intramembrane metalloprotease [Bacteroidota bacterium]MCW5894707.1 CPBP family intramembrane metalloprotease [Bacteroidota bacterium]